MNDPDTARAMVGAVDAPKREEPAASPDFAADVGKLAAQLEGCTALVDAHTDEIVTLPPRGLSARRHSGHGIWRERAFQLRGLRMYFEALSRSDYAGAAAVSMDRSASG